MGDDLAPLRRKKLREYCDTKLEGNQAALARLLGKPTPQIADMLAEKPRKAFGAALARQFERKLALRPYYLETADNNMRHLTPAEHRLLIAFDALLPAQQANLIEDAEKLAEENRRNYNLLQQKFDPSVPRKPLAIKGDSDMLTTHPEQASDIGGTHGGASTEGGSAGADSHIPSNEQRKAHPASANRPNTKKSRKPTSTKVKKSRAPL